MQHPLDAVALHPLDDQPGPVDLDALRRRAGTRPSSWSTKPPIESYSSSSGRSRSRRSFTSSTGTRRRPRAAVPSAPQPTSGTSTSYSSVISPTSSSRRSSRVTRPAVPPCSSTTTARCTRSWRISREQLGHPLGLGDEPGRPGQRADRVVAVAVALGPHEVLQVGDADHVVDRRAGDRQPAEPVEDGDLDDVGDAEVAGDGDHVGPRAPSPRGRWCRRTRAATR